MRSGLTAIWPASQADVDDVLGLLLARAQWLAALGSDQWHNFEEKRDHLEQQVLDGRTWIMRDDDTGKPLGTIRFTDPDPDFWTADEQQVPALYLAKLATDPNEAGRGLGRLLLDFAMYQAVASQTVREVRFDVWRTADRLQRYYLDQGWTRVRTVVKPGRFSGALFTRAVPRLTINTPPPGLIIAPARALRPVRERQAYEPGEREHGGTCP